MPELPEVETVRRGLALALTGESIAHIAARRGDLRWPLPADFAQRLQGRRLAGFRRRGKYLLIDTADPAGDRAGDRTGAPGPVWLIHLGMSGRLAVQPAGSPEAARAPGPHDHVTAALAGGGRLVFTDPRRFGGMDLIAPEAEGAHPRLASLGCEPLGPDLTPGWLDRALAGRRAPIKAALLDQRLIAGLGNIYACEILFRAAISPRRKAATIPGRRAARLVPAIRSVLEEAIAAGGSSLRDHRAVGGDLGYFQHSFAVYGRAGETCPGCVCGPHRTGGIHAFVQSGRTTYACPTRQR